MTLLIYFLTSTLLASLSFSATASVSASGDSVSAWKYKSRWNLVFFLPLWPLLLILTGFSCVSLLVRHVLVWNNSFLIAWPWFRFLNDNNDATIHRRCWTATELPASGVLVLLPRISPHLTTARTLGNGEAWLTGDFSDSAVKIFIIHQNFLSSVITKNTRFH